LQRHRAGCDQLLCSRRCVGKGPEASAGLISLASDAAPYHRAGAVAAAAPPGAGDVVAIKVLGGSACRYRSKGTWSRSAEAAGGDFISSTRAPECHFLGIAAPQEDRYDEFCHHCLEGAPPGAPPSGSDGRRGGGVQLAYHVY